MPLESVIIAKDLFSFLQTISKLNDGPDHGTTYELVPLPPSPSVDEALLLHFSAQFAWSLRNPTNWSTGAVMLTDDWQAHLSPILAHWFFDLRYSPSVDESVQRAVLQNFFRHLREMVGEHVRAYEAITEPPTFYECAWVDYVFEREGRRWLLHLGVSD